MYRRVGGFERPELTRLTDSPPDLDLLDFIELDLALTTPCLTESSIHPVKMKSSKTAPATLAIGSPSQWMGEETKPVRAALQTLKGFDLTGGFSLESLLTDRAGSLNTPPPLPILSDLGDFIPSEDKVEEPCGVNEFVKQEEESSEKFCGLSDTSGHSPLRDLSVENTVNLRDLFSLPDLGPESAGLLQELNSEPVAYLAPAEAKRQVTESQQYEQLLYLPAAVYQEEQLEDFVVEESKATQQQLSPQHNFDGTEEILTITEENFNRLTACTLDLFQGQSTDLDLIQEARNVLGGTKLVNQAKPSQSEATAERGGVWEAPPTGRTDRKKSSGSSRKRRIASLDKESDEYKDKRARNNESVRKSRDKAKLRQEETESRLYTLSTENSRLQSRVDALEKELSVLRSLFSTAQPAPTL